MKYEQYSAVPVVEQWERYVAECLAAGITPGLPQFAGWLLRQTTVIDVPQRQELAGMAEYEEVRLLDKIGMLIWRISRFMRVSFKQHFEGHPLQSIDEFTLLSGAHHMQEPTKTQLFNSDLMETTTGLQMLARLIKQGLAEEKPDPTDRRQKRVTLTSVGEEVYQEASDRMDYIGDDLFHVLSTEELEVLEGLLLRLNRYHTERLGKTTRNQ